MPFLTFFSCTNPKINDVVPQSPTKELLSRLKTYDLDSPLYKEKEEEPEAVSTSPENTVIPDKYEANQLNNIANYENSLRNTALQSIDTIGKNDSAGIAAENTEMFSKDGENESVISELTDYSEQYYINNGISPECSSKSTDSQLSSASTVKR